MLSVNEMLLGLALTVFLFQEEHNELAKRDEWDQEYDFVVIGAGAAGSVVAARLAEKRPENKVLLLEAGGPAPMQSDVPGLLQFDDEFDWGYTTVPQKHTAFAYKNSAVLMKRGKMMGGSATHNLMNYYRGKIPDYNRWSEEFGLTNWSYNHVLKYFLKSENMTDLKFLQRNAGYHSDLGPLAVSLSEMSDFDKKFFKIFNEAGHRIVDLSDQTPTGLSVMTKLIKDGRRWEVEQAFLLPNKNKENLHILAFSRVTKLVFSNNRGTKVVKSVIFKKDGELHSVDVRKECILSAGVFGTPQILMLSGIGPKDHLSKIGIKTILDLPVGDNFHDHITAPFYFTPVNEQNHPSPKDEMTLENFYSAYVEGKGPLTIVTPTVINYRTEVTKKEELDKKWPDSEIRISKGLYAPTAEYKKAAAWDKYLKKCQETMCYTMIAMCSLPRSRGTVRLRSADTDDSPLIDPRYLSKSYDFDVVMAGTRELIRMANLKQFRQLLKMMGPIPDCEPCPGTRKGIDCDKYLKCHIQHLGWTLNHPVGSCRAGVDDGAPVDSDFRVKGTANLRVIDSSVIPRITSGHVVATTIMIGEFGADTVLTDN